LHYFVFSIFSLKHIIIIVVVVVVVVVFVVAAAVVCLQALFMTA
jgi:hypothetical protein